MVETVARLRDDLGRIDVLVNNAGVIDRAMIAESEPAAFRKVLDLNVTAAYLMARECAVPMAEQRWGRIVNIGSILSVIARPSAS